MSWLKKAEGDDLMCLRCGKVFTEPAWINYSEYPGADRTSQEPVSPCCQSAYSDWDPASAVDRLNDAARKREEGGMNDDGT